MQQMLKGVLSVVVGAGFMSLSSAEAKEVAASTEWFSVKTDSLKEAPRKDGELGDDGTWLAVPANNGATLRDRKIDISTDYDDPLTFQPCKKGGELAEGLVRVTADAVLTACETLPDINDARTGLCVLQGPNEASPCWYVFCKGVWTKAEGAAAVPEVGAEYVLALEVEDGKLRWKARKTGADADEALIMEVEETPSSACAPNSISFYGSTTIGDFDGRIIRKAVFADGVADNVEVVVIEGAPLGAKVFVDKTWKHYKEGGMNETPAGGNGLTYLQSYVLGLNPASPLSKPLVLRADQDGAPDKVAFRLGATVRADSGAKVKYRVKTIDPAGGAGQPQFSDYASAADPIVLDLPTGTSKVRHYKVEVTIE